MKKCIILDTSDSRKQLFTSKLSAYPLELVFSSKELIKQEFNLDNVTSFVVDQNQFLILNEVENDKEEIKKISSLFKYQDMKYLVSLFKGAQLNNVSIFMGIIVNLVLSLTKLIFGLLINSIAFISDAMNNFSDLLNQLIGYVGYKLSLIPADKDHPYGHGRIEYITSIVIGMIILGSGILLMLSSYNQIVTPEKVKSNFYIQIVLLFSILLKLLLFRLNSYLQIRSGNYLFKVVAMDSLNDILLSIVLIINFIALLYFNLNLDGFTGFIISAFIIKSGYDILKDMIDRLIGQNIDPTLQATIKKVILASPYAFNVHDLTIHDYGAQNYFGSIHVEVESHHDLLFIHDEFDKLEKAIYREFNVKLVIHLDPMEYHSEKRNRVYRLVNQLLSLYYSAYDLHDFRFTNDNDLEFDLEVDFKDKEKQEIVFQLLQREIKKINQTYTLNINFEYK